MNNGIYDISTCLKLFIAEMVKNKTKLLKEVDCWEHATAINEVSAATQSNQYQYEQLFQSLSKQTVTEEYQYLLGQWHYEETSLLSQNSFVEMENC